MAKSWNPGEAGAKKLLNTFLSKGLDSYDDGRNRPDQQGTSSLSPHLHFGEISPRRVWHAVRDAVGGKPAKSITGSPEVYLRELAGESLPIIFVSLSTHSRRAFAEGLQAISLGG